MNAENTLLTGRQVMARYGYKSRSSCWQFVAAKGLPYITLNARKILFSPAALR